MTNFYVTTPIFYPNAKLHLGHAYVSVIADFLHRYQKLIGNKSFLTTGSDEHSTKVVKNALAAGLSPKEYTDDILAKFLELFKKLDIDYDLFIRTSDKKAHWRGAVEMLHRFVASGDIYKSAYEARYCTGCESFVKEADLIDGKCPLHDEIAKVIKEDNYFFRLSKYQDQILDLIDSDKVRIFPQSKKEETLAFIKRGLTDASFSRPISVNSWAIPIPGDPEQGMYVWCDALTSYLSAIGFPFDMDTFNDYWPASCHLVGKDILRFHAITWIGMLISANLKLPKNIVVHGLLLSGGRKMSKTLGNVIDPEILIEKYGSESLRYFFARHITLFDDGEISAEIFRESCRSGLVNGLGNVTSRILAMAVMYKVPIVKGEEFNRILARKEFSWYTTQFENFQINQVVNGIWAHIKELDVRITTEEPFKLYKINPTEAVKLVTQYLEILWSVTQLLKPFLPETSEKIIEAFDNKEKIILFKKENFESAI
jgi:methionyl-tRNA synthetase